MRTVLNRHTAAAFLAGGLLASAAGVLATGGVGGRLIAPLTPAADAAGIKLGLNASLGKWRPFPEDSYWNVPVDQMPADERSEVWVSTIGPEKNLHPDFGGLFEGRHIGIPYVVVPGNQPRVPVKFEFADESDHDYYPVPPNPPIEGYPNPPAEGDRHLLMVDRDNMRLFELFALKKQGKQWIAGSGAIFDLRLYPHRTPGWTSADAAGLPIFPALVKWEEVHVLKEIRHALRFTARQTQMGYVFPATHRASRSQDASLPPMGIRARLKANYNISGFPPECQVILKALKKYGMILADNGNPWFIQGAPDQRWNMDRLAELKKVKGSAFEIVQAGSIQR